MAYYQYTVKYVCGEGDNEVLVKGICRTAINIQNPYDFKQSICWKVVSPTPDGNPTPPRPWVQATLPTPRIQPRPDQPANLTDHTAGSEPAPAKPCQPPVTSQQMGPLAQAERRPGEFLRLARE